MTRCRTTAILTLLLLATVVPLVAAPHDAAASPLRSRLQAARSRLSLARHHLADARAALSAAVAPATVSTTPVATSASPEPAQTASPALVGTTAAGAGLDDLRAHVTHWRDVVRRWGHEVVRLAHAYRLERRLATWERRGQWRPIISVAAAKYHVSAAGIYRMMMRESGGQRFAGANTAFKGLFQYHSGTWAASWNPWRGDSIYDGSSQIFATCYAVHRGYGSNMWTSSYAYAF